MSTHGQFNTKSPTIKRILREAAELSNTPSADYHAAPLETNLFEWHFTLRGPPLPSPFSNGFYHGRIVLPPTYPLRPPSFRFLTPSGRFEPNREICLSISGHHEESWQPAWGIRTALVAIRSFMDSEAKGQLGGIESGEGVRKRLAAESGEWKCAGCGGKTNREIMREREVEADKVEGERVEEKVPEELKLGYRDEMGKGNEATSTATQATEQSVDTTTEASANSVAHAAERPEIEGGIPRTAVANDRLARMTGPSDAASPVAPQLQQTQHRAERRGESSTSWIDVAIVGIAAALGIMLIRKMLSLY